MLTDRSERISDSRTGLQILQMRLQVLEGDGGCLSGLTFFVGGCCALHTTANKLFSVGRADGPSACVLGDKPTGVPC